MPRATRSTPQSRKSSGGKGKQAGGKRAKKLTPPEDEEEHSVSFIHTDDHSFIWTEESEALLFRNILRLKPVGPFKDWKMSVIKERLSQELDHPISAETIWAHLSTMFNLKALNDMENTELAERGKKENFTLPKIFNPLKSLRDGLPPGDREPKSRKSSTSVSSKEEDSDQEM